MPVLRRTQDKLPRHAGSLWFKFKNRLDSGFRWNVSQAGDRLLHLFKHTAAKRSSAWAAPL